MDNLYTTTLLTGVINQLKPDPKFFLEYFPSVVTHEQDTIIFDQTGEDSLLVMPYAHPKSEAKSIEHAGYQSKYFRPAYLKSKVVIDPENSQTRLPGEALGGSLSGAERERLLVAQILRQQRESFDRRLEQMASEIFTTGKLNIRSKDEFDYTIDFERDEKLTKTLKGEEKWSSEKTDIVGQIEDFVQDVLDRSSGASVDTLVFGKNVWKYFRQNASVKELLDIRRGSSTSFDIGPNQPIFGMQEKGYIGAYKICVHTGTYTDPFDNKMKRYVPENSVLLLSKHVEGTKHFASIRDRSCQMKAVPYFVKAIETQDPSNLYFLAQSAPLLVPKRINASSIVTVI
jgi:hypothetical protein